MQNSPATHELIAHLLACYPALTNDWERERRDRGDTRPNDPLDYIQAAALAQVVTDAFRAGNRECLPALFNCLEDLLSTRPMADRDLLVVGFLEDLQGVIGWAKLDPRPFYDLLGPKSRSAWDNLVTSWENLKSSDSSAEVRDAIDGVNDSALRKHLRGIYRPPK
jgi:hypothetical protein